MILKNTESHALIAKSALPAAVICAVLHYTWLNFKGGMKNKKYLMSSKEICFHKWLYNNLQNEKHIKMSKRTMKKYWYIMPYQETALLNRLWFDLHSVVLVEKNRHQLPGSCS